MITKQQWLVLAAVLTWAAWALPAQAFQQCCCRYDGSRKTGECAFTELQLNQSCKDTRGPDWVTADDPLCRTAGSAQTEDVPVQFKPNITIPDSPFRQGQAVEVTGRTIGEWVSAVYVFLSGAIGILAAAMVMWGGFKWLTAAGNAAQVQEAKSIIYSSLIAILLTLGAYTMLNTLNPELVKIKDLTSLIPPVGRIEQTGELVEPPLIAEALLLDPSLRTEKDQFNSKPCPTEDEMRSGFEVYLTGYYRPSWPPASDVWKPSGGYPSFPCNVAMQCSCQKDKNRTNQCMAGGFTWTPCDMSKLEQSSYCRVTASGSQPVDFQSTAAPYTAAASSCFGFQTQFSLSRPGDSTKPFRSTWLVQDRGGDIRGRHLDLFFGEGETARGQTLRVTGRAIMKVKVFCTAGKNPICKTL